MNQIIEVNENWVNVPETIFCPTLRRIVFLQEKVTSRYQTGQARSYLDTEETSIQKYVCPICGSRLHYQEKVDGREAMRRFLDRKLLFYDPAWSKVQENKN